MTNYQQVKILGSCFTTQRQDDLVLSVNGATNTHHFLSWKIENYLHQFTTLIV